MKRKAASAGNEKLPNTVVAVVPQILQRARNSSVERDVMKAVWGHYHEKVAWRDDARAWVAKICAEDFPDIEQPSSYAGHIVGSRNIRSQMPVFPGQALISLEQCMWSLENQELQSLEARALKDTCAFILENGRSLSKRFM